MKHFTQFLKTNTHATNASFTGRANDCRDVDSLRVVVTAPNTSTPVYTVKLQGSEDVAEVHGAILAGDLSGGSVATWFDVELPDGTWEPSSTFTDPAADTITLAWNGVAALVMALNIEKPYAYMRLVGTRTGGGSASAYWRAVAGAR